MAEAMKENAAPTGTPNAGAPSGPRGDHVGRAARSLPAIAEELGFRLSSGRGEEAPLSRALADPDVARASVMAGIQMLNGAYGKGCRWLSGPALADAEGGSPCMLASSVDLAWHRLADANGVIRKAQLEALARLSPGPAQMALDDGFLDEVQQAARRLGPVAPTPDASAPGR